MGFIDSHRFSKRCGVREDLIPELPHVRNARYAAISIAALQIGDLLMALLAVLHQAPPRPSQQRASDEMNKPIGITAKGSQSGRRAKSMQRSPLGGMMRPNGGRPDDRATGYRR